MIHGRGGTDFRPVFEEVERMREKREFSDLKALIYFTDGDGIYPEKKPDYETAFVFVKRVRRWTGYRDGQKTAGDRKIIQGKEKTDE